MLAAHPVQILMDEHRIIESVLDALERQVLRLGHGAFPAEFLEKALDFFANYADGCHHFKEEDTLFPAMVARGVPREGGPVGVMLYEHQLGRGHLKAVRESLSAAGAGDAAALDVVHQNALGFIQMLRQHIFKEDNVLFRMAQSVLGPADVEELRAKFTDESNPKINAQVRGKYVALAEELAKSGLP